MYELETAGKQGLLGCLGVFLDHILNPTLHDLPFLTEVFHLDQDGKSQGVVYNEMLARENSDSDLVISSSNVYVSKIYANLCVYSLICIYVGRFILLLLRIIMKQEV